MFMHDLKNIGDNFTRSVAIFLNTAPAWLQDNVYLSVFGGFS